MTLFIFRSQDSPLSSLDFSKRVAINLGSQLIGDIFVVASIGTYQTGHMFFVDQVSCGDKRLVQKVLELLSCVACFCFGFLFIAGLLGSKISTRIPDSMSPK